MKRKPVKVALLLTLVCLLVLGGCRLNQPDFEDFPEHEAAFISIKNFLVDYIATRNDDSRFIVDLNGQFLTVAGEQISTNTLEKSVKAIYEKGFHYIEVTKDYMIFWEDETGYYGVLWSASPKDSINQIVKSSRPYIKSRKLSKEWYEVGALDSI